jgi:hypothetical protein
MHAVAYILGCPVLVQKQQEYQPVLQAVKTQEEESCASLKQRMSST